jgi:hypothetical protein
MGVFIQRDDGQPFFPNAGEAPPVVIKNNKNKFFISVGNASTAAISVGNQNRLFIANVSRTQASVFTRITAKTYLAAAPAAVGTLTLFANRVSGVTRAGINGMTSTFLADAVGKKKTEHRENLFCRYNANTTSLASIGTAFGSVLCYSNFYATILTPVIDLTFNTPFVLLPGHGLYFQYVNAGAALTVTDMFNFQGYYINVDTAKLPNLVLPTQVV